MDINLKDMLPGLFGGKKKRRKMTVGEAREILQAEEEGRLIDLDRSRARPSSASSRRASSSSTRSTRSPAAKGGRGPDVSREGVQRDLLPIVEGTTVNTKYGMVKTDHILFIAAGAFHVSQAVGPDSRAAGPLPDPRRARRAHRGRLRAHPDRAGERARSSSTGAARDRGRRPRVHRRRDRRDRARRRARQRRPENIGARRLHTVLERLLDEISFEGPENAGKSIRIESPTCRARSPTSSRTRTCRDTCSEVSLVIRAQRGTLRARNRPERDPVVPPVYRVGSRFADPDSERALAAFSA